MIRIGLTILAGFAFVGWYIGSPQAVNRLTNQQPGHFVNQSTEGNDMDHHIAVFAAGCFWGVEATFRGVPGVINTTVGYTGGETSNPTYKQVCSGTTQHAEAVRVEFDPAIVSYTRLIEVFFSCHDPTTLNRQGPDIGTQYRSAIFYQGEEQQQIAFDVLNQYKVNNPYQREVVTQLEAAAKFYPAEDYHQQYLEKRGLNACKYNAGG